MDPVERKIFSGKIVWGSEKHTKMLKKVTASGGREI